MIIHTKNLFKGKVIKFLDENQDMNHVLKIKDRITIFLRKRVKNTKEIEKELRLNSRSTRKALFDLEKENVVKRIRKKKMRRKFGESDSWTLIKDNNIAEKIQNGKICIFYKTFHKRNISKKHYLLIQKEILLNEDYISALGFFQAEGSKKRKATETVNSEPILISLFLNFLEYFGIKKKDLSFKVIFNKKITRQLNIDKKDLEKKSKKFWDKIIDSTKYKYRKSNYTGTFKGRLRKEPLIYGSLSIEYCSTIFRAFLAELLKKVKNNLKDKKEIIAYLRGFFAGEAYVGRQDREIQIASIDPEELHFAQRLLKRIGVTCSISKKTSTAPPRIIITNLKSFLILENCNIFKFHPFKKRNLLIKILNYQSIEGNLKKQLEVKLSEIEKLIKFRYIN